MSVAVAMPDGLAGEIRPGGRTHCGNSGRAQVLMSEIFADAHGDEDLPGAAAWWHPIRKRSVTFYGWSTSVRM